MTKEQKYRAQMQALGIYEEIFEPEIATLCRIERELTRAMKAWSATAQPAGSAPSFTDPHYPVIQRLRAEILQHRESLGLTPKALRKLIGVAGSDAPETKDLITHKLDQIAARVAAYDGAEDTLPGMIAQSYDDLPMAREAARISDLMDRQDHGEDPADAELRKAVAEDMG